ncbi:MULTISPECIES: sulfur carrier protein ThiS [unclassified Chromohalobacter]|uniref:sulfur carrier protein ThiS n=1 Tax=unclassified Chromohalobacter TaxID=2628571 RepID=UPI0024699D66|nr:MULTISPECIES: sulfur carrier protein ThiS [unclassified Chromohalobacter]
MHIQLNGDQRELASQLTISELIEQLALTGRRIAVEVNEEIVPRSQHAEIRLSPGDRVEIVHAIGGG